MGKRRKSRTTRKVFKRKRKYVPKDSPRYISSDVRSQARERDDNKCVYCGKREKKGFMGIGKQKLEYGHYSPHSKHGARCIGNIQMECFDCNRGRSDKVRKNTKTFWGKYKGVGKYGCTKNDCNSKHPRRKYF